MTYRQIGHQERNRGILKTFQVLCLMCLSELFKKNYNKDTLDIKRIPIVNKNLREGV